jgi:hypothetical protein
VELVKMNILVHHVKVMKLFPKDDVIVLKNVLVQTIVIQENVKNAKKDVKLVKKLKHVLVVQKK